MKDVHQVTLLLFVFIGLNLSVANAQKPPFDFGKVSEEELLLNSCPIDSTASAVVLSEYCNAYFDYSQERGFVIIRETGHRIKIFNKDGYDQADFSIPLWKNGSLEDKLTKVKGFTYNLKEGKIDREKLSNDGIYKEEVHDNLERVKITMPLVKEGSVIELSYTVVSEFFYDFHTWYFQHEIPTMWSEYTVQIPEYFSYNKSLRGYIPLDINETSTDRKSVQINEKTRSSTETGLGPVVKTTFQTHDVDFMVVDYRWVAKDVPAFILEEPLTSIENYISRMDFELASYTPPYSTHTNYSKTWEDIQELLSDHEKFGSQLKGCTFLNDKAEEIISQALENDKLIEAGYSYVQQNMRWNERNEVFATSSLRNAFKDQQGSSADINLMLVAMLRKLNLDASPVILSTRSNGMVSPAHPTLNNFNYVIAAVELDDRVVLLDATDKILHAGMLPVRVLNGQGRIIRDKSSDWISIDPSEASSRTVMYTIDLTDPEAVKGTIQSSNTGYPAISLRSQLATEEDQKEMVEEFAADNDGLDITEWDFQNLDDLREAVKERYEFSLASIPSAGNLIYLDAVPFDRLEDNPYKLEERLYPVEYPYPYSNTNIFLYKIPPGYTIEDIPESTSVQLPDQGGRYLFEAKSMGNMIQVTTKMEIGKQIYLPEEYQHLKEFHNLVMAKSAEKIVLKQN